jgi:hypothetical protein
MIQPVNQQAAMPLSEVHARNITFADGAFYYDGGPLRLEGVQLFRSNFDIPLQYAGNQKVKEFLAAVMTGQAVTLDLS